MDLALLKKFFANQCKKEEVEDVLAWINSSKGRKQINQLIDNYDYPLYQEEIDSELLLSKLRDKILGDDLPQSGQAEPGLKKIKKTGVNVLVKVAAAVGVFVFTAAVFYYVFDANGATVNPLINENFVEKLTEKGQKLTIHLNDGSKVILNSASQIIYSKYFTDSIRLVKVRGEAFFEVARDPDRPFVVQTGNVRTQALGTSFNVIYRKEINNNNISLVSGKVKVYVEDEAEDASVILNPGERVNFDYPNKTFEKDKFDPELVTAWKDGVIYFKDAGFIDVVNTLENWYGVDISWNGKPEEDWKFSAKFENENLRNILEALKYAQESDYNLDDGNVTIILK